jgi:hypothetical protein
MSGDSGFFVPLEEGLSIVRLAGQDAVRDETCEAKPWMTLDIEKFHLKMR